MLFPNHRMASAQASEGASLPPSLPSPAPSDASSVFSYRPLPHPRPSPLKPGSRPENSLIAFLDHKLLQVSRKYAKKFNDGGYTDAVQIADDLEKLVDLLWVSSTRRSSSFCPARLFEPMAIWYCAGIYRLILRGLKGFIVLFLFLEIS